MAISNQKLSSALPFDGRDGTGTAIKVYDHSRSYDNHDYILYAYENITHVYAGSHSHDHDSVSMRKGKTRTHSY